jgi:ABC-type sulfate transport system substrate-binding protein
MYCVLTPCPQVWTVDKELKGWTAAQKKFFDAGQVRSYNNIQ